MYRLIHKEEKCEPVEKIFMSLDHILDFYSTYPASFGPYMRDLLAGNKSEIPYSDYITLEIEKI